MDATFTSIDQYIKSFPKEVQTILQKVRKTIKEAAPDAEETIKYAMPTFIFHGNLVHFAGYKNHVGFYPTPPPFASNRYFFSIASPFMWTKSIPALSVMLTNCGICCALRAGRIRRRRTRFGVRVFLLNLPLKSDT